MLCFRKLSVFLAQILLIVRGQCPTRCKCPSIQEANCSSLALTNIPTERCDRYLQNLDISDNDIVSLGKTSLTTLGVISLVHLNASRNYISDIDEEAFLGQSKLQTVDLSRNSLMIIEPKTFIRNPSLQLLSLSSNKYLRLLEEVPFLYSESIRVLHLSDCNLYHLPPETFQKLPNLQELYISHNKIEVLNSLQSVGRLTLLDVRHNYLTDVQSDIFTALPELMHLNLSYNRLSTLNMTVVPQLARVSSSDDLNGNPWLCDCYIFNTVYSWCLNNSMDLGLVCSSPPKCEGQQWKIYENAGCDYDNTDSADQVEYIDKVNYTLTLEGISKYRDRTVHLPSPGGVQVQPTRNNRCYLFISISLLLLFFCLVSVAGVLFYLLCSRTLKRSGPVRSDAETHRLSSSIT